MAENKRLRIAVVDDHELMRNMLAQCCNHWAHGEVVMKATDGVDYEEQLPGVGRVDVAIVDLRMPRRDGFQTMAWIREKQPDVKMLAISYDPSDDMVHHALQSGANGMVDKGIGADDFYAGLEALRTTGYYASPLMMKQLKYVPTPDSPLALRKKLQDTLAEREFEFLLKYIDGRCYSRQAIAKKMGISVNTAETYRKNIVEKTGARTRVEMYKLALRFGLVKL